MLQSGHRAFTLAVKLGRSCSSYLVVLVSGSRSAIVPPLPPLDDVALLVLDPASSLLSPHAASAAVAATHVSAVSARVGVILMVLLLLGGCCCVERKGDGAVQGGVVDEV